MASGAVSRARAVACGRALGRLRTPEFRIRVPPNVSRERAQAMDDLGDCSLRGLCPLEEEADGRAIGPRREGGAASGPGRSETGA